MFSDGKKLVHWNQGKRLILILIDTQQLDYAGSTHDLISSIVLYGANHIVDTTDHQWRINRSGWEISKSG